MASINEVGPGDYVKVGSGRYEKIARIEKTYHPDFPNSAVPRSWTVVTENGQRVGMFEARSYHKKEELEK